MEWSDPNIDADYDGVITLILRGLGIDVSVIQSSCASASECGNVDRLLLRSPGQNNALEAMCSRKMR
jgi:hypothetical protein